MAAGTEWQVKRVTRVVDGDTVRVIRSRIMRLGDDDFLVTDVEDVPIRLTWVDTPERGQDGYHLARQHLADWITPRAAGLRVVVYESAGWDRLLGDLLDSDGRSASQHLMIDRGWPPYKEK